MKKVLVTCHMGRHYKKFGHYDIQTLLELGCEVHFAANFKLDIDKVADNKIFLHQIDFSRNPFSLYNFKAYFQLKKIINGNEFDLIHCQSPVGGVVTRLAAKKSRKKGTKVIYTAHGFHFYKGAPVINWLLFYPVEKYLAEYTDTLITINNEDYQLAKNKFSKRCENIEYVPGVGINPEKFNFTLTDREKLELRKSLGLKKDAFVMIYPAELSKRKNQIWLIKTIKEVLYQNSNIHLLLPGNDCLKGKCNRLIKKLQLEKQVHLLGFRLDIHKLLQISNLALSSAKQEGLPVNIMEAIASNIPVLVTECRGMVDLLGKESDFIVKTREEFINQILKFYNKEINENDITQKNSNNLISFFIKNIKKEMIRIFKLR